VHDIVNHQHVSIISLLLVATVPEVIHSQSEYMNYTANTYIPITCMFTRLASATKVLMNNV